jgi:hypothetical protein
LKRWKGAGHPPQIAIARRRDAVAPATNTMEGFTMSTIKKSSKNTDALNGRGKVAN